MKKSVVISAAVIAIMSFAIFAADVSFKPISGAEQIFGNNVRPRELKGRVVFLVYWGVNCPPCKVIIPQLVDAQKKYAKTKFIVIASHRQCNVQKAKEFLKDNEVNFPVFQQLHIAEAPCARFIPHAFIIDHNGKVVEKGSPSDLLKKIDYYIEKVPSRYFMISDDFEVKYCISQAKALSPDRPALPIIKQLERMAEIDNERGKEAKVIIEKIDTYLKEKSENLIKSAEDSPARCFIDLQNFLILTRGLEQEAELKKLNDKLKNDQELMSFLPLVREFDRIKERLSKRPSRSLEKQFEAILSKIENFKDSSSASVAREASAILDASK